MLSSITLSNVLIEVPEKEHTIDLDSDFSLEDLSQDSAVREITEKQNKMGTQCNKAVHSDSEEGLITQLSCSDSGTK